MLANLKYKIPKRSKTCTHCGAAFVPKQSIVSIIFQKKEEYERNDLCLACWDSKAHALKQEGIYWKSQIPCIEKVDLTPVGKIQKAFTFLERIQSQEDPELVQRQITFVLALFLQRQKQLILRKITNKQGKRQFWYERLSTGDVFCIPYFSLDPSKVKEIQGHVISLFSKS